MMKWNLVAPRSASRRFDEYYIDFSRPGAAYELQLVYYLQPAPGCVTAAAVLWAIDAAGRASVSESPRWSWETRQSLTPEQAQHAAMKALYDRMKLTAREAQSVMDAIETLK